MHRIDSQDNVNGLFSNGDKVNGIPGTKLDAAWHNALQEEIATFIEAQGITLVKGTNTQFASALLKWLLQTAHTFTAEQTFSGASGDGNAAQVLGGTPVVRKLKQRFKALGNTEARVYTLTTGALEIILSASWNSTTGKWAPDRNAEGNGSAGSAAKLVLGYSSVAYYTYPATTLDEWSDSAWVQQMRLPSDGRIAFTGVTTGADGSNPPASTPITNELRAKNTCKAWGAIAKGSSTATLLDGFNASVTKNGDNIDVAFASPMANSNYAVSLSCDNFITPGANPTPIGALFCTSKSASGFTIQGLNAATGTSCLFDGSAERIDFIVFGTQS